MTTRRRDSLRVITVAVSTGIILILYPNSDSDLKCPLDRDTKWKTGALLGMA